jgi:hypothetical protein
MLILVRPAVNRVIRFIIEAHCHVHSFLSYTQKASIIDAWRKWSAAEMNHPLNCKLINGRYCLLRIIDATDLSQITQQVTIWNRKRQKF